MRTTFGPEGEIRGTDLLAALVALWRENASGSLQFSRSGAMAGFELAGGEVVAASSSDARFETGAILVRAGKLDASALERLSAQEGGDRARAALQAGLLTKREWRWGEKIRAVEVLSDLLTWLEGDYTFFRTTLREPGEFRLTIPRLILELFLRSRDRGLVLHYLGGADVPLVRSTSFDSEFATFGLTSDAEAVVRLIDGNSTAAEIASEAPAEPFAVEKLLAALVTLGLIHPEYAVAPESRPAFPATPEAEAPEPVRSETPPVEPEPELEPEEAAAAPSAEIDEEEPPTATESEAEAVETYETYEATASEPSVEPVSEPEPELEPSAAEELSEADEPELESLEPEIDLSEQEPRSDYESQIAGGSGGHDAQEDLGAGPSELYEASPFDRPLASTTGVGGPERPRTRSVSPVLWLLVLLGAAVAAILLFRSRSASHAAAMAAVHTPVSAVSTPAVAAPDGVLIATGVPTAAATAVQMRAATAVPTAVPTRKAPTAPPATRPTASRAPASAPSAESAANTTARQPWLDRAARDQKRLAGEPKIRYAIQLELACETQSLVDAWKHDRPTGTMWLMTTDFQGRTCFKVLWGRYPSLEAARRAQGRTPAFFSTSHNRPAVVAVR
jgi:septal ring-binding cell division protein DamX